MDSVERGREVFNIEIQELRKVADRLGDEFRRAVETIYRSRNKVVLTGIGKSGLVGKKIAASLASTGTHAVFLNAAEAVHGDLGMVCRGDCVVAISNSGQTAEVLQILDTLKRLECTLIAMTGRRDSELARRADIVLDIGVDCEACRMGLVPTASSTATLVMGDALVVCLMELRDFQPEHFGLYHPGGALGRRLLTRVRDRMETRIPTVRQDATFQDVLREVTDRRLGVTLVVDHSGAPVGVITDGDIRRAIQRFDTPRAVRARDFMTPGFQSVGPDVPVHDALELMDLHKITTLMVKGADPEIVGILSIHHIFDLKRTF